MRTLARSVLCALALTLTACTLPLPVAPQPAPGAAATVTLPAVPAATVTLPPSGSPIRGPLVAGGQLLTGLVVAPGSPVRYALLGPGLARSEDGGRAWQKVSSLTIRLPLVSPSNPNILYAGDMPSCYRDDEEPLFRRSADGGQSWQDLAGGRGIRPVAAAPGCDGEEDTLHGISCAGVSVSRDGGQTWSLAGPTHGFDITGILPVTGDDLRLLAVLTSEGGSSHLAWFNSAGSLEQDLSQGFQFWGMGIPAQAGSDLYIGTSTGVWRMNDASGRWERFGAGLEDVILQYDPSEKGLSEEDAARGFGLLALAGDPYNPRRLALGTVRGLYLSDDAGEHWRLIEVEPLAEARVNQVVWEPSTQGALYAATPSGVYALQLPG